MKLRDWSSCSPIPPNEVTRISFADENRAAGRAGTTGMEDVPDEALLEGYATGDPQASECFVRKFGARIYGAALPVTRDRRDAEEVAQDAFVRAWRYAGA